MTTTKKIIVGSLGFVILVAIMSYFNINGKAIKKQEVCKAKKVQYSQVFNNAFVKVAQIAEIPEKAMKDAKDAFKEIYQPLIEGRYKDGRNDGLMRWVQENNPQFDTKEYYTLYKKLADVIEDVRNRQENYGNEWTMAVQDYNSYVRNPYNSLFLSAGRFPLDTAKVITSSRTKGAMESGEENDIQIFK